MNKKTRQRAICLMLVATCMAVLAPAAYAGGCRTVTFHRAPVFHKVVPVVEKVVAVTAITPVVQFVGIPTYNAVFDPARYLLHQQLTTQNINPAPQPGVYPGQGANGAYPNGNNGIPPWAQQIIEGMKGLQQGQEQLHQRLLQLEGGRPGLPSGAPPFQPMPKANGNGNPPPAPPPQAPNGQPEAAPGGPAGPDEFMTLSTKYCASCHDSQVSKKKGGDFAMFDKGKISQLTPNQIGAIIYRVSLPDTHEEVMPKVTKEHPQQMPIADRLKFVSLFVRGPEQPPK